MNTAGKLAIGAVVFGRRVPLTVGWNITHRCNLRCAYCMTRDQRTPELDTPESLRLVGEMADAGVRLVTLSGGEPFLRRDLEPIVEALMNRGIQVVINSNGTLVRRRPRVVQMGAELKLRLDGPPEVHDAIRGPGVHDKVIDAIEFCREAGAPVEIRTVIGTHNVDSLDYALEVARQTDIGVFFQPAYLKKSGPTSEDNPLALDPARFRKAVAYLIDAQKAGERRILNSSGGLRHMMHWPDPKRIFCLIDRVACDVEPDGRMFGCDTFPDFHRHLLSPDGGFRATFDRLSFPHPWRECWCGPVVEANLVGGLNVRAALNVWRRLGRSSVG